MVFKNINQTVSGKIQFIRNKKANEDILLGHFKSFLVDVYGEYTASQLFFSLEYSPSNKRLMIITKSKIFANDLILRLGKLIKYLSEKTKEVKEVVIK